MIITILLCRREIVGGSGSRDAARERGGGQCETGRTRMIRWANARLSAAKLAVGKRDLLAIDAVLEPHRLARGCERAGRREGGRGEDRQPERARQPRRHADDKEPGRAAVSTSTVRSRELLYDLVCGAASCLELVATWTSGQGFGLLCAPNAGSKNSFRGMSLPSMTGPSRVMSERHARRGGVRVVLVTSL